MFLPFEADLQRFAAEAVPFADRAGDPNVGQKIHFEPIRAVPFASFAPSAADVEAEAARLCSREFSIPAAGRKDRGCRRTL